MINQQRWKSHAGTFLVVGRHHIFSVKMHKHYIERLAIGHIDEHDQVERGWYLVSAPDVSTLKKKNAALVQKKDHFVVARTRIAYTPAESISLSKEKPNYRRVEFDGDFDIVFKLKPLFEDVYNPDDYSGYVIFNKDGFMVATRHLLVMSNRFKTTETVMLPITFLNQSIGKLSSIRTDGVLSSWAFESGSVVSYFVA